MRIPSDLLTRIFIGILAFLVLGWLATLFFFLIEPTSPIENVMVTNVTDHQVSISWTTSRPTRGALVVSGNGKFPLLPFFIKDMKRDDTDKGFQRMGFYHTHQVTVDGLKSKSGYQYIIYQGWKKVYRANFMTGSTLNSLPNPNPVYGQVLQADKKTLAQGVLIYLQAKRESTPSAYLSTITNREGRWSLDLGNLRTSNFTKGFSLDSKINEVITVQTGKDKYTAGTKFGQDQPWPDIILLNK